MAETRPLAYTALIGSISAAGALLLALFLGIWLRMLVSAFLLGWRLA